ncbi:hypothetical protein CDAR_589141 [Caerostris darwini]|uniref:Uncharacterized protein n=1 Tax=Caerostris darwini TaxID=1538125 RepID=A0AAV4TBG0_9ARAC|nr:hypothetical protein CDAR_589141 [Caerostris darwini]
MVKRTSSSPCAGLAIDLALLREKRRKRPVKRSGQLNALNLTERGHRFLLGKVSFSAIWRTGWRKNETLFLHPPTPGAAPAASVRPPFRSPDPLRIQGFRIPRCLLLHENECSSRLHFAKRLSKRAAGLFLVKKRRS